MTDPGFADRTYIEPITTDIVEDYSEGTPDVTADTWRANALNLAIDWRSVAFSNATASR
jgi:carbamoylphosphate synthase large subunit